MGNINSEYLDLEYKEKSLFSFDVKLVEISVEKGEKKLEKKVQNYLIKLKFYPSSIVLKQNNIIFFEFKYNEIISWYSCRKFFKFKNINDECFSFLTTNDLPALDIEKAFKQFINNKDI